MSDQLEYSVHVYLKSGKVVASDPVSLTEDQARTNINYISNRLQTPECTAISIIRNGHTVVIMQRSIELVEFHWDVV